MYEKVDPGSVKNGKEMSIFKPTKKKFLTAIICYLSCSKMYFFIVVEFFCRIRNKVYYTVSLRL